MLKYLTLLIRMVTLPLVNIFRPSESGKQEPKVFIGSSILYMILISISSMIITAQISKLPTTNAALAQILYFGSFMFPLVITTLGLLLHLNKPAESKEHRLLRMLALPWQPIASFIYLVFIFNTIAIINSYFSGMTIDQSNQSIEASTKIVILVSSLISGNIFWTGLKNIRNTSKFRNLGDIIVISVILALPYITMHAFE